MGPARYGTAGVAPDANGSRLRGAHVRCGEFLSVGMHEARSHERLGYVFETLVEIPRALGPGGAEAGDGVELVLE